MSLNKKVPDFGNGLQPRSLTPPLVAFLQELSGFTPAAFVQASYEGGCGEQIAILWQASKIILGPLGTTWGKFGNPHNKVRMEEMAINTVLRRMGVRPQKGKDEFDIVDLGRKRRRKRGAKLLLCIVRKIDSQQKNQKDQHHQTLSKNPEPNS